MVQDSNRRRLASIEGELSKLSGKGRNKLSPKDNNRYFDALRQALILYEEMVSSRSKDKFVNYRRLRDLAARALDELGGQGCPSAVSLKQYDHHRFGPFLGVSDEGSTAGAIRAAALASPKMQAIGCADPIVVGVAHDAERLGAIGETAVGPEEYREIRLECMGRILTSTNVGTRLNLRYYKKAPVIEITAGPLDLTVARAIERAKDILEPFWHTPDKVPRPITVFAHFAARMRPEQRLGILRILAIAFKRGDFCDSGCHQLGLMVSVRRGSRGLRAARDAIKLAKDAGLTAVIIDGTLRKEAADKISMPGLLNYFSPGHTTELLGYAAAQGIPIGPKNRVDTDTVARNVWGGLLTARNMGLELGKYGLFPLTFDELNEVCGMVQRWFCSWTAAPAFYIDFPAVDLARVYTEQNIAQGVREWLKLISAHNIPVVLIDTADKDKGRRLLKSSGSDKVGILPLEEVAAIDAFAAGLGIKVLWAGGIIIPQVFELGRLGVFGVYVTSAAAVAKPVTSRYRRDPMLAAEREPTFHGIYRTKLMLEAGFLTGSLKKNGFGKDADLIEQRARELMQAFKVNYEWKDLNRKQREMADLLTREWKLHLSLSPPC